MNIIELAKALEDFAPLGLQESYDNSGLLIGDPAMEITGALITVDVTEPVMNEALRRKCNLIVSHHPLIFKGLKKITGRNSVERIVSMAVKHDVAIYAIHTNLDNVNQGTNAILAAKIGLINTHVLQPKKDILRKLVTFCPLNEAEKVRTAIFEAGAGHIGNYDSCSFSAPGTGSFRGSEETNPFVGEIGKLHFENELRIETIYPEYRESDVINALLNSHPYEEVAYDIYTLQNEFNQTGAGMIGELGQATDELTFLQHLKKLTSARVVRHSELLGRRVKKVAICGGSGSFLIQEAIRKGADIFVTSDVKYHDFFEAEKKMVIADIGHYESEQFAKELIYNILIKKFSNFAVLI